jgi:hypothetical protein
MKADDAQQKDNTGHNLPQRTDRILDRLTGAVLTAVAIAMTWMVIVSYRPDAGRLASTQLEVILMLVLLSAALLLVSLVAFLHTRD